MKRILFCLALLLTTVSAHAQWDTIKAQAPVRNIIKISPFHFVEGTFVLAYEHLFANEKSSINLMAGMHSREQYDAAQPAFGTVEEFQWRYYVAPPKNTGVNGGNFMYFKGFYAGPYLYHRYRSQTRRVFDWILQTNTDVKENINEVSAGVQLGVQVAFGNRLFVDLYTGGGVKRSFGRNDAAQGYGYYDITQVGYNGVVPKIGFMIGIGL